MPFYAQALNEWFKANPRAFTSGNAVIPSRFQKWPECPLRGFGGGKLGSPVD